jgi:hypothetical protein
VKEKPSELLISVPFRKEDETMVIQQLSVFLQNELGRLKEVTDILYKNNINICALSIAETTEYGILRMIVSDIKAAEKALKDDDFSVKITDVICIEAPDIPGSLHKTLQILSESGINLSYMYGYSSEGVANLILKVSDPAKAMELLNEATD